MPGREEKGVSPIHVSDFKVGVDKPNRKCPDKGIDCHEAALQRDIANGSILGDGNNEVVAAVNRLSSTSKIRRVNLSHCCGDIRSRQYHIAINNTNFIGLRG